MRTDRDVKIYLPKEFLTGLKELIIRQNADMWRLSQQQHQDNEKRLEKLVGENTKITELLGKLETAIKENKVDNVEVSNFPEQKEIKLPEYPKPLKEIEVKKPSWYQKFNPDSVLSHIKEGFQFNSRQFYKALDYHTKKENAFAVRLVDKTGKSFYDAMFQAISGSGFQNVNATIKNNSLEIARGNIDGISFIHKFGNAPDFDTGDGIVDIWDGADDSGINQMQYTYSTTADVDSVVSSNAGDGQVVEVQGLDTNFDQVIQTATLNGQTRVALTTSLIRVFRIKNQGTTDFVGDVYVYVDGALTAGVPDDKTTIRATVHGNNNQTLMAIYTIPVGKTGYMDNFYAASAGAKKTASYQVDLFARPVGGVFQLKHRTAIEDEVSSNINKIYLVPEKFSAKTDIVIRVTTLTANITLSNISAGFDITLINN